MTLHSYDEESAVFTPVESIALGVSRAQFRARYPVLARRCVNPVKNAGEHYLPDRYGDFGDPIVIGVVGAPAVGKTVYITALIHSLLSAPGLLADIGLTMSPLDVSMHQRFVETNIRPLFRHGADLPGTGNSHAPEMVYAFHVESKSVNREFALGFFDVAGEDLSLTGLGRAGRYLSAATALIFVVDPGHALPRAAKWPRGHYYSSIDDSTGRPRVCVPDGTFDVVCEHFATLPHRSRIPVSIIVTKSDLLQYHNPHVARWIFRDDDSNSASVLEESADVYALLETSGAEGYLRPVHHFGSSTLHFASATGIHRSGDRAFPLDQLRPRRVLRPLFTVLRALGVL